MILLIWLSVASLEAARHVYLIRVKKISPNKGRSLAGRVLIAAGLGLWEVMMLDKFWLQMFLTYLSTGWWIHNTIIALSIGQKVWYLNGTGVIDKRIKPFAPYFWILLTLVTFTLMGMCLFNE